MFKQGQGVGGMYRGW